MAFPDSDLGNRGNRVTDGGTACDHVTAVTAFLRKRPCRTARPGLRRTRDVRGRSVAASLEGKMLHLTEPQWRDLVLSFGGALAIILLLRIHAQLEAITFNTGRTSENVVSVLKQMK